MFNQLTADPYGAIIHFLRQTCYSSRRGSVTSIYKDLSHGHLFTPIAIGRFLVLLDLSCNFLKRNLEGTSEQNHKRMEETACLSWAVQTLNC